MTISDDFSLQENWSFLVNMAKASTTFRQDRSQLITGFKLSRADIGKIVKIAQTESLSNKIAQLRHFEICLNTA